MVPDETLCSIWSIRADSRNVIERVILILDVIDQRSRECKVVVSCLGHEYDEQPYCLVVTGPIGGEGSEEIIPRETSAAFCRRVQGVTVRCTSADTTIAAAIFATHCLNA